MGSKLSVVRLRHHTRNRSIVVPELVFLGGWLVPALRCPCGFCAERCALRRDQRFFFHLDFVPVLVIIVLALFNSASTSLIGNVGVALAEAGIIIRTLIAARLGNTICFIVWVLVVVVRTGLCQLLHILSRDEGRKGLIR